MPHGIIVVVEDEPGVAALIKSVLEEEHFSVYVARSCLEGRGHIEKHAPLLVVLDRHLPDRDGLDLCRELRSRPQTSAIPILFLTSKKGIADKTIGLELGGDDYLTKPFNPLELVARIHAILRRSKRQSNPTSALEAGPIRLDTSSRIVSVYGREVKLNRKEFDCLQLFLEHPDRVFSRQSILGSIWGSERGIELTLKNVDMLILHLRRKLGKDGELIETVPGVGYRFRPN